MEMTIKTEKERNTSNKRMADDGKKFLRLEKEGPVGILIFDAPASKANTLGRAPMIEFHECLEQIKSDKNIGSLVIMSAKPSIFIAGADLTEIQKLDGPGARDALRLGQDVFNSLENLTCPTLAAIHGACLGGGMELALACDYRMASDSNETKLGLPEVNLGILPGWGGTQRMPRLTGLASGLDLILSGRSIASRQALKMGLVDEVVPVEWLRDKAVRWALALADSGKKRKASPKNPSTLEKVPGGRWLICDTARKQVLKKSKGNYPAPLRALDVIQKTYGGDLTRGLKMERETFAELIETDVAKNLIRLFFLTEKVKKDTGVSGVVGRSIQNCAVLGAGVMGGGIAQLLAGKNVRVRVKDLNWAAIGKALHHAYALFKKQVDRKRIKKNELQNAMERLSGTLDYRGFQSMDMVIEAVAEDIKIKSKVFRDTEEHIAATTVLATNTSSLPISQIAEALKKPERLVGMHFFNPVDKMPLIEVIAGKKSSPEAIATVFQFAKRLGKTPVVVKDSPGFVVNRILAPYLNEAVFLLQEGVEPVKMDSLLEKFGMPMGPCTLLDEIGLDVAAKVGHILVGAFGARMQGPVELEGASQKGWLGKKNQKGIYLYEKTGKAKGVNTELLSELRKKASPSKTGRSPQDQEILKRLIYIMVNEAARCIEEKLVQSESDLDVAMIFGTGFAPFRGGLLRYADTLGAESIVSDLELLARNQGTRFQPSPYLQQIAIQNQTFYSRTST